MTSISETAPADKTSRPKALPVLPDNIPVELKEKPQWVVWRYVWKPTTKRWDKPPRNAYTGELADSTDPATWAPFADALSAYQEGDYDGIGFVATPEDNLAGGDLDHCRNAQSEEITPPARRIVAEMDTYTEGSPSATGLRFIAHGRKPDRKRSKRDWVEIYDGLTAEGKPSGRYLTITGHHIRGTPTTINDRQEQLVAVYNRELKPKATASNGTAASAPSGVFKVGGQGRRKLDRLINRCATAKDRSKAEFAACCEAIRQGIDKEEIWQRLQAVGKVGERGREYFDGTWQNAEDEVGTVHLNGTSRNGTADHEQEPDGPPPGDSSTATTENTPPDAVDIIADHLRELYQPVHREGSTIYSGRYGRPVRSSEAILGADKALVAKLLGAADVPRVDNNPVRGAVPALFRKWAPTAWCEVLRSLPDQEQSTEVSELAREQFRTELAKALKRTITLDFRQGDHSDGPQCRTVIAWCALFARTPRWADVRGRDVWSCLGPDGRLRVALRVELFSQIGVTGLFAGLSQRQFSTRCELYDCGRPIKVSGGDKRAVELEAEVVLDLRAIPEDPDARTDGPPAPACAREECASVRPSNA